MSWEGQANRPWLRVNQYGNILYALIRIKCNRGIRGHTGGLDVDKAFAWSQLVGLLDWVICSNFDGSANLANDGGSLSFRDVDFRHCGYSGEEIG